jgi:hypothetical protein
LEFEIQYARDGSSAGLDRYHALPSVVMKFLQTYVERVLTPEVGDVTADTPALLVTMGGAARRAPGDAAPRQEHLAPLQDVPSPHRRARAQATRPAAGVAMEVLEQQHDLEQVRALLGHARMDTTQIYASIRPAQLKRAVAFYEDKAARMLSG